MLEKQIIVHKDYKGELWYSLQVRNVYFLFRGKWRNIYPMWHTDYDTAFNLLNTENKIDRQSSEGMTDTRCCTQSCKDVETLPCTEKNSDSEPLHSKTQNNKVCNANGSCKWDASGYDIDCEDCSLYF